MSLGRSFQFEFNFNKPLEVHNALTISVFFLYLNGQRDDSLIVAKDDSLKKISLQNPDCNSLARWTLRYLSSFKQTEE